MILSPDEIRAALNDRNRKQVARATGLHYTTVLAIAKGDIQDPSWSTIKALSDYLTEPAWQSIGDVAAKVVRDVEAKRK